MLTALLVAIAVLGAVIAGLAWRIVRELASLSSRLGELQASVARWVDEPAMESEAIESAEDVPTAVQQPVAARRSGSRAVVLPNGQRRIDHIRDRYYRDGLSRGAIRAEIDAMLASAGVPKPTPYQAIYAATRATADPRLNRSRRGGGQQTGSEVEDDSGA